MPRVSILMSVRNGLPYLEESIQSLLGQTFRDFELLLLDDGSTDATPDVLGRVAAADLRIRLFRHESSIGLTRSLNELLQAATGEFIARQDCDDLSLPNRLEVQTRFLDAHPEILGVVSDYTLLTEEGEDICVHSVPTDPQDLRRALQRSNIVCHGTLVVRSRAVREAGGYLPDFPVSQDYALLLSLLARGPVASIPQSLYRFRLSASSVTFRNFRKQAAYVDLARHRFLGVAKPGRLDYPAVSERKARAFYHRRVGKLFVAKANPRAGRPHLGRALRLNPFSVDTLVWSALSLLPAGAIRALKSVASRSRDNE